MCRRRGISAALVASIAVFLAGCGDHGGDAHNERPFVQIMTRPQAQRIPYAVDIFWTGWDRDGVVDHYQYTLDVPDDVSLDELNDPAFTGVTWTDTDNPGAMFLFSTPYADTLPPAGTLVIRDLYSGPHNVFVRAVDNEGAFSRVDYIEFVAENVAPKTTVRLTSSGCLSIFREFLFVRVGEALSLEPDGVDPDRPGEDKRPAFFEWKLIPVPGIRETIEILDANEIVNTIGASVPWNRTAADSNEIHVEMPAPGRFLLAVRSIDVQGAAERRFETGRNAAWLEASDVLPGAPTLTISSKVLGSFTFPGSAASVEAFAGTEIRLDFSAGVDQGVYVTGFCARVDPGDVDPDCDWSLVPYTSLTFDAPGVHAIMVQVRDCLGRITAGTLILHVIDFPRDREVLYVDDHRRFRDQGVTDAQMDAMAIDMIVAAGFDRSDVQQINTFGESDELQDPVPITLSDLARYRYVVWSVLGTAYNGNSGLSLAASCEAGRVLQRYIGAGGAVWVYGQKMMGAFRRFGPPGSECRGVVGYDETLGLNFPEGTFPCDFAGMCGGDFRTVVNPRNNGLIRARPTARAAAAAVPFPTVEVDSTLFSTVTLVGGIPLVDAMFQPTISAGLDTLYVVDASAKVTSLFRNKPIAFRYADPDPVPGQGPVALFGFPAHLLKQGSGAGGTGVQGMARALFAWFRSQERGVVAREN